MPIAETPSEIVDVAFKGGLRGIFYDGCIERKEGSSFRSKAHAHTYKEDKYQGWICFRSIKRIYRNGNQPSHILLHELAHIISGEGHTRKMYETVRMLGGRIDKNDRRIAPVATRGL